MFVSDEVKLESLKVSSDGIEIVEWAQGWMWSADALRLPLETQPARLLPKSQRRRSVKLLRRSEKKFYFSHKAQKRSYQNFGGVKTLVSP